MSDSRESSSLCASCDRCRSRKTRCDGQRPCSSCKQRYMKANKVTNCDDVDESCFECVYSPAKKRGPVPGHKQMKASGGGESGATPKKKKPKRPPMSDVALRGMLSANIAKAGSVSSQSSGGGVRLSAGAMNSMNTGTPQQQQQRRPVSNNSNFGGLLPPLDPSAAAMQQQVLSTLGSIGTNMMFKTASSYASKAATDNSGGGSGSSGQPQDTMATAQNAAQQQLAYIQQLQLQQQMQAQQKRRDMNVLLSGANTGLGQGMMNSNGAPGSANVNMSANSGQRPQLSQQSIPVKQEPLTGNSEKPVIGCSHPNVVKYLPLTHPHDPTGMHLRACYTLSFGNLFGLPTTPADDEYCRRFDKSLEPHQLPKFDVAAMQAARFAELALGALADTNCSEDKDNNSQKANNELMVALADASVWCLRDCVAEPVHPSLMLDVARTHFFHAILRAQLGDMDRYFKYRRVCLRHLAQLDDEPSAAALMAAVSLQDSLAYMIYNASEDDLPAIDVDFPRVSQPVDMEGGSTTTDAEKKYGISILPSRVASNPINQMWFQGAPPVLINESSPRRSRVLDALACVIRSSLDEAKARQTKEPLMQSSRGRIISRKRKFLSDAEAKDKSATEWAVEHHPDELSCSKLLAAASDLMEKEEEESLAVSNLQGHRLLLSALDTIVNADKETEQVQLGKICTVLGHVIERPMLLFQGGPTYHIINNCAIHLAHIINELHDDGFEDDKNAKKEFDGAIDVYNGSKILLAKHRMKLPAQLQCHEIPTADVAAATKSDGEDPVIDLSQVALCPSHNCQDCISTDIPAKDLAKRVVSANNGRDNRCEKSKSEEEFDISDQTLLGMLSRTGDIAC